MLHRIDAADHVVGPKGYTGERYFEGSSGKLAAGELPPDPQGYAFFCFEMPLADGCVELMRLGFTASQIEEAIS
jgi:hypothetical protein